MVEDTAIAVFEQPPQDVIKNATLAAKELQKMVYKRGKTVKIGGNEYLRFEDWQTLGKFYGITSKVVNTEEIWAEDKFLGFVAHAEAVVQGIAVSAADAECRFEEANWHNKPKFQVRSMAQTRACAKSLRNCLGWIAVLAGYEGTPAEEMDISVASSNERIEKYVPKNNKAKPQPILDRDPESIKSFTELFSACFTDFQLQPKQVLAELNVKVQSQITELPEDCYRRIAASRA